MTNKFELAIIARCAKRVAFRYPASSLVALKLSEWLENAPLGLVWDPDQHMLLRRSVSPELWKALRLEVSAADASLSRARPDALERNIRDMASYVSLTDVETEIFSLAVRAAPSGFLRSLCDDLTDDARLPIEETLSVLTNIPVSAVRKAVLPSARMITSGLLVRGGPLDGGLRLTPSSRMLGALEPPSRGLQDTLNRLFAEAEPPNVEWDDFAHLGAQQDFVIRLVEGSIARRERGINLLFHGAPGTGKTEFCKAIAARLGLRLHSVGEADVLGEEPTRAERLQQLRLGQRLLATQGRSLILFDEMEDLFPRQSQTFGSFMGSSGSKIHMNRLLESNPVPTLWTTNNIMSCDPAYLRRMTFTMEMRTPSALIRARVWSRLARQHRMSLSPGQCDQLAQTVEEAPALVGSALRAAHIAGGGPADVQLAVEALTRAVRGGQSPAPRLHASAGFDPAFANADHDLGRLAEQIVISGAAGAASLCLSGAPGTGKSAFARYLAARLDMPILERRASDLLDKYVGGSERNIAQAFSEARDTGAFLIFDEADSLIGNRAAATQSWEITQVNEMLTWMENHPLPFACTTNLADRLDPAALRRFSLRVSFLPLDNDQRHQAFHRLFGMAPPPGLADLDQLTPGDFAVIVKRVALLNLTSPHDILAELMREQMSKPDARAAIGFRQA